MRARHDAKARKEKKLNANHTRVENAFPSHSRHLLYTLAVVALQERVVQLLRASTVLRVSTLSRNILLRGPGLRIGIMPPKQATLGYVKTQLTLGSVALTLIIRDGLCEANMGSVSRRFFTLPAGTKPPAQQQSKLKVAKKSATKEKEEEDADRSIAENDQEVQEPLRALKLEDEEGDAVMTGTPEVEVEPKKTKGGKKPATKTDETGGCQFFLPSALFELICSQVPKNEVASQSSR